LLVVVQAEMVLIVVHIMQLVALVQVDLELAQLQ
jgi:hypothetical protein